MIVHRIVHKTARRFIALFIVFLFTFGVINLRRENTSCEILVNSPLSPTTHGSEGAVSLVALFGVINIPRNLFLGSTAFRPQKVLGDNVSGTSEASLPFA